MILLLVLLPIALLDSTSMIPLAVVPMAIMLGGYRPIRVATSFVAGIFAVYLLGGLVLAVALDALVDVVAPIVTRVLHHPTDTELVVQLVLGVGMVGYGWRLADSRQARENSVDRAAFSPAQAFVLGAMLTVIGLPGAVPYLGAIDLILRADTGVAGGVAAIVFYNLAFALPLAAFILVRVLFPVQCQRVFSAAASLCDKWGKRVVVLILLLLGVVLTADAVGWWLGWPLIPL